MKILNNLKEIFIKHLSLAAFILALIVAPAHSHAESADVKTTVNSESIETGGEDRLDIIEKEPEVYIASKSDENKRRAPSMVTVITAEEIHNTGAAVLTDVLRAVPGFDILKTGNFGAVLVGTRGYSDADNKINIMIDGHSLNMPYDGGTSFFFDDISLQNVKQIEIVRGPGTALYGGNSFLSVINIVTKSGSEIDGVKVNAGFGSYDTQEYRMAFGKKIKEVDIAGFGSFYNTNGLSDTIKTDALSGELSGNTPGDTDDGRKKVDLNLNLAYKDIKFISKYINKDTEPFTGSDYVLTNDGKSSFNYAMGELSYKWKIDDRLTIKPRAYYDHYDFEFLAQPRPDGFEADFDGDGRIETFPQGMIAKGLASNKRAGAEIQTDYELFDSNRLTFGLDYKWERQNNVAFRSNFDPLTNASLGPVTDVSDTNWIREVYRQVWAVYLQDQWDISKTLSLTLGLRHDHYSDFEGSTNPRAGLVWDFNDKGTFKLLYGQAFRPPAFNELYIINNPQIVGNSSLDPETIRTYEAGVSYEFTKEFSANINYFFNVIRDEIGLAPVANSDLFTFENIGKSNIQGVEFETAKDFGDKVSLFANYTYVDVEADTNSTSSVPRHKGNVGVNLNLIKYLNANINTFVSGPRIRRDSDTRDESPGYAIANLTLIAKEFFNELEIKASIFNLLDKDYNDPSPVNTLPDDLPRPGRTFFISLDYEF